MRSVLASLIILALAGCSAPAPEAPEAPVEHAAAVAAENAAPTGNDLTSIAGEWGTTPEACADPNKVGTLEVSATNLRVAMGNREISSVTWTGETVAIVSHFEGEAAIAGSYVTHTLAHDAAAGTLTWTDHPRGDPQVYRRCT
jgi:hypothetical protein